MSESGEIILEYPVQLTASVSKEVDELIKKLEQAKTLASEVPEPKKLDEEQAFEDALKRAIEEVNEEATGQATKKKDDEDDEAAKKIKDLLDGVDSKGIAVLKQIMQNPASFTEAGILSVLARAGPYGLIAAALISLILSTPELVKTIVEVLGQKGGPLNIDYRFNLSQQLDQEFDRKIQFDRALLLDPVITVNTRGFVAIDPSFEGNSLILGNLARSARIGINLSSLGYVHGI